VFMKAYNKLSIQGKLLLLGVLPAATVAITLAIYFATTRLNDMYDLLHKTNQSLAVSIAETSVNAVYTGNQAGLTSILAKHDSEPNVISITIADALGAPLYKIYNRYTHFNASKQPDKVIVQAIQLKTFDNNDFSDLLIGRSQQNNDIIGYVSIALSYKMLQQRQLDILLNSFYISTILLISIGFITRRLSNSLGKPILELSSNVKNLTSRNFNLSPIEYHSSDEISTLISGIQDMALVIQQHQNTLEQKVSFATKELRQQNNKLFDTQEKLIKATREKSKFISHISHEIRTPLNGIIGFLDATKRTALNKEQRQLINSSLLSAKNLHIIINEVLDLAQLEAGKMKVNRTDFNLKESIEESLSTLSILAESNGVTLNYKHDPTAAEFINQDRVKLGQVLLNLVGNAIKFSPNSTVDISLTAHKPKIDHIEICVRDQGVGISENHIEKLFHAFSQLDNASNIQGTGLGLVITKHLLSIINGTINVKSTLGEGSVFCFSFPYIEAQQPIQTTPLLEEEQFPDLSTIKVLVADDNEINRLLLTHLLETQHAKVVCANDGRQALEIANQQDFDLLLLDLRMPFRMGNEVLYEIRQNSHSLNNKTPAIAVTAHITSGKERADHISTFDGYLVKPIDQAEFFSLIERLLHQHDKSIAPFTPSKPLLKGTLSNTLFDYSRAMKNMNSDKKLLKIILRKFFNELSSQRTSILSNIQQGDFMKAAETIHKVQGSCAYCGANALQLASKQLETDLRNKEPASIQANHKKFEYEVDRLINSRGQIMGSI